MTNHYDCLPEKTIKPLTMNKFLAPERLNIARLGAFEATTARPNN